MKYGILSDIHSNLEALTVVLDTLAREKVNAYISCGDIVGYGPNPNECVSRIKALPRQLISAGNHDWAACGLKDISWFNEYAQKSLIWTANQLTQENKIYLSELPKIVTSGDMTVVHGSPRETMSEYLMNYIDYKENIPYLKTRFTFAGHTHVPAVFDSTYLHPLHGDARFVCDKEDKYVINAGSVGQPRDGNKDASCAVFDTDLQEIKIFRLPYDVFKTQEKMYAARLPAFLIERLSWGK